VDAPPALLLPIQKTDESPGTQCEARHESAQHRADGKQRTAKNQGQLAYPDQFVDQAGRPGDEQAKIRNGFKKGITSQIHGGNATMDFAELSHIPGTESTHGDGRNRGKWRVPCYRCKVLSRMVTFPDTDLYLWLDARFPPLSLNLSRGCECLFQCEES